MIIRKWFVFLICILTVVFAGCGKRVSLPPQEIGYPVDHHREQRMLSMYINGPGGGLYAKAAEFLSQGKNDEAELILDRALRIEPGNPAFWYSMGKVKYRKNNLRQAVQHGLKSKSLAGRDQKLHFLNDGLIRLARSGLD